MIKSTVLTPEVSLTPAGINPRLKRFTVVGIFKAGGGFGFDKSLAYVSLSDAQKLLGLGNNISGLHAQVKDVYAAPYLAQEMMKQTICECLCYNLRRSIRRAFSCSSIRKNHDVLYLYS